MRISITVRFPISTIIWEIDKDEEMNLEKHHLSLDFCILLIAKYSAFAQPCSPHYNFTLVSMKLRNTGTTDSTITQEPSLDLALQNALKFFSFRK